jgi:hypothetical protein
MTADDETYFLTWGGSDFPLTVALLGSAPATNVEWPGDGSWWAEFDGCATSPGKSTVGYYLQVCNAVGCTPPTYLVFVP